MFKLNAVKDDKIDYSDPEQLIKVGALNVLVLGYRGIELWREKRDPIEVKSKQHEKKA